ncbi:hypothetical protein J3B00_002335 [Pseudomonas sp. BP8]|nr:hypothetical protein [Pseudomonas sp. BP8]
MLLALRKVVRQRLQKLQGELLIRFTQLLDDRRDLLALILRAGADGQQQLIGRAAIQVGQFQQLTYGKLNLASFEARYGFPGNLQVLTHLRLSEAAGTAVSRQLATNVMWARLFDWQGGLSDSTYMVEQQPKDMNDSKG